MILPAYHTDRFSNISGQKEDRPTTTTSTGELFNGPGTRKGMIATWIPSNPESVQPILPQGEGAPNVDVQGRYGFQFHYNPKEIALTYAGSPDIDLGLTASGEDPYNLVGTQVSQSTITFNIGINRIADLHYYDPATGMLKANAPTNLYAPKQPSAAEQKKIYEYGTMYDVEYLLAALLGFKVNTKYRDVTADLGFIAGRPIELILGKRLRYLGLVTGVSVNHVQFDQRMVPTWSTIALSFSRIPDFASL
jgi:hypothetical protein